MILVLSDLWLPFPGGAERLMFNLARDLYRRGEHVIVATGYHNALPFDGPQSIAHLELPVATADELAESEAVLAGFIAGCRPDVILTHHYWALTFEDVMRRAPGEVVQVVLNGRRLPNAALAVYISEYVRDVTGREHSRPFDMTILPPAFDDVRADSHGDAIGFIKPLHHKGVDLVYDIARLLPDRKFVVLRGEWQDIETIVDLPNVEYMEPVEDIRDFYSRCRIVLMPSLSEDAGTVPQECAVNGMPCIASFVGGLAEANNGGWKMLSRDPVQWADAIVQLDDERVYAEVVAQEVRRTPTAQTELLDELAKRISVLMP